MFERNLVAQGIDCVLTQWLLNTLRPRQDGRHFPDDICKCISLNENVWISIKISLKFVPKGPLNNIPALFQIMACADQATSHYLNQWWSDYRGMYVSPNELRHSVKILLVWWIFQHCGYGKYWPWYKYLYIDDISTAYRYCFLMFCFVVVKSWVSDKVVIFSITSLAPKQLKDCPGGCDLILNNMGKSDQHQTTTKYNRGYSPWIVWD